MITSPTEIKRPNTAQGTVELSGVGKKYPAQGKLADFWALRDVSLTVSGGEVIGIIGRNGAGKTTLLNIIAGILSATEGKAALGGRALGLFNLGVGFQDELSGRENVFLNAAILGADKPEIEAKFGAIVDFSELGDFIKMPLGTYSQGMRLRLAFSIVANLEFDILVIDEVLAVGDALFQNKCFERLMDFRRAGKTLIITTQSMELIERLCGRAALLDHGSLVAEGEPRQVVNRYRALLNSEKFFVGPERKAEKLFTDTKKWADDVSSWGQKLGAKEAVIDAVKMFNRLGLSCNRIKSGEPLKVRVDFSARDIVKEPHFGVAIFRADGVYCYGPNTEFDGCRIPGLKKGRGWFELRFEKVLLAPGEYRVSVAIWDKKETLAYDYHNGYYRFSVRGDNPASELLRLPFKACLARQGLEQSQGGKGKEKDVFMTNEPVEIEVLSGPVSIFRDDGILCQKITIPSAGGRRSRIIFPWLALLPGKYKIFPEGGQPRDFRMVFNRPDHGTVYLRHQWKWGQAR